MDNGQRAMGSGSSDGRRTPDADVISLFVTVCRHFELPGDAESSPERQFCRRDAESAEEIRNARRSTLHAPRPFCRRDAAFDGAQARKSAEEIRNARLIGCFPSPKAVPSPLPIAH